VALCAVWSQRLENIGHIRSEIYLSTALQLCRADLVASLRKEAVDLLASMEDRREEVAVLFTKAREESRDPAIIADLDRGLRELYEES
jgi:hypothetical protein